MTSGALTLKKSAGIGNGRIRIDSTFYLTGDFIATIDVTTRPLNPGASFVFVVRDGQSALADVYFRNSEVNNKEVWGIIFKPSVTQTTITNAANSAAFRIRREGNVLHAEYSTGGGFVLLQSKTNSVLAVPVTVGVILIQEFGNTASSSGSFDNLSIIADGVSDFVPPSVSLTKSGFNTIVSWPNAALGFALESTDSLSPPIAWKAVTNAVTSINGRDSIELIPPDGNIFFRLKE